MCMLSVTQATQCIKWCDYVCLQFIAAGGEDAGVGGAGPSHDDDMEDPDNLVSGWSLFEHGQWHSHQLECCCDVGVTVGVV